jgi:hypothetical protein
MKTVNEQGLKEIRDYLSDLHKQDTFTDEQVSAWATEVEDSLNAGNGAEFEIKANDSKSGHVELCRLDDEGYDVEYFDSVDPIDFGASRYKKNHDCARSGCTVCVAFEH